MITFYEYAAWRRKTTLPDAATLLALAGISPRAPHDVEVMRLIKTMKKTDERTPMQSPLHLATLARPHGTAKSNQMVA